jgi:hypothetical protein
MAVNLEKPEASDFCECKIHGEGDMIPDALTALGELLWRCMMVHFSQGRKEGGRKGRR